MTEQEQKAFTAMREALISCIPALEQYEVKVEREWGCGRSLEELEERGEIPHEIKQAREALTAANAVSVEPKVKLIPTAEEMGAPVEPQLVGCAYYESNGACCESGEPCKADVQNNSAAHPQATEPAAKESLTIQDIDTCRQWFDSVQDTNGGYLTLADYVLADKIYRTLGMRVPSSITAMLAAAPEAKQ